MRLLKKNAAAFLCFLNTKIFRERKMYDKYVFESIIEKAVIKCLSNNIRMCVKYARNFKFIIVCFNLLLSGHHERSGNEGLLYCLYENGSKSIKQIIDFSNGRANILYHIFCCCNQSSTKIHCYSTISVIFIEL